MFQINQVNSQSSKNTKFIFKSAALALVSSLISVAAINSSVHAATKIGCNEQFIKEFTVVPYFTNTTNQVIPAGTVIHWTTFWAGKPAGNKQTVLSKSLAPGKTFSTGIQFSGDNNSCTASY
jgi:hypothetical protein